MARDLYNPIPDVVASGGSSGYLNVNANPKAFGSGVANAVGDLGQSIHKQGERDFQEAVETRLNDRYANQYTPELIKLRTQYESLMGEDKVAGHQLYIENLEKLNKSFVGASRSEMETKLSTSLAQKIFVNEQESAANGLAAWQKKAYTESTWNAIKANNSYGSTYYNNPAVTSQIQESNKGHILKMFLDGGLDLNNPDVQEELEMQVSRAEGDYALKAIDRAVSSGDAEVGFSLRKMYSPILSGSTQNYIDDVLHTQSMVQTGQQALASLKQGGTIPDTVGAPAWQVQAMVADAAELEGVDVNTALTYLKIESNNGQNLGTRGTIAQDKLGGTLQEQVARMPAQIREAQNIASKALGRPAEAWEGYLVHQQGAGGGPALMKAAAADPNALAVDVLAPFYVTKNDPTGKKIATKAILGNLDGKTRGAGGSATMTAGDFVNYWRDRFNKNAQRAQIQVADSGQIMTDATVLGTKKAPISSAIKKTYETRVPAMQEAVTPIGQYNEFNKRSVQWLEVINSIPNSEKRNAVLSEYEKDRAYYEQSASVYKSANRTEATKLAINPEFKTMSQVPAKLMAYLQEDPEMYARLSETAKQNAKGEVPDVNDPKVIRKRGEMEKMKYSNPKAFASYDFSQLAGVLPGNEIEAYQKSAAELYSNSYKVPATEGEQNSVIKDLRDSGVFGSIKSDNEEANKNEALFRDKYNRRIQAFTETSGKKPNWTDLQNIKDDLLLERLDKKTYELTPDYIKEEVDDVEEINDIPEKDREEIIDAWKQLNPNKKLNQLTDDYIIYQYKKYLKGLARE